MLLDGLLGHGYQLQGVPDVGGLPDTELRRYLFDYLIACRVDNKSYKTLAWNRDCIGYFVEFVHQVLKDPPLLQIDRNHIRLYILSQQERVGRHGKKLSPEAVNGYYRSVHTFFNWLEVENVIPEGKNPFAKLTAPSIPEKLVKAWPDDIVERIDKITAADRTFCGIRNRAIVLVLFDSLVREKELAGMQVSDFYPDQGLFRVMGKGGRERIVRVGEEGQKALLKYLLRRNDSLEAMWVTEEGQPMMQRGIEAAIRRISDRAELPKTVKRGAHSYRHTGATNYLKNGGNLKSLQELMGHKKVSTTERYLDSLGSEAMIRDHTIASPVDNFLRRPGQRKGGAARRTTFSNKD